MNKKSILKIVVAFSFLAFVLIFLGVNFVPRILASSQSTTDNLVSYLAFRPNYTNENYPRSVVLQPNYSTLDWFERHPELSIGVSVYSGSDWIERHPSVYYQNSDWAERNSSQSK